jgi:hypothetical protein
LTSEPRTTPETPRAHISQQGWAVYYHAEDGTVYRVLDTLFARGRHTVVATASRPSHYRIFRPNEGPRRIYKFRDLAEERTVTLELLALQLRAAEFMATQRPGQDVTDPR